MALAVSRGAKVVRSEARVGVYADAMGEICSAIGMSPYKYVDELCANPKGIAARLRALLENNDD